MSNVMDRIEATSDVVDHFYDKLTIKDSPFSGVEVFKGTSEADLFDGFIQGLAQPSAVVIYRGSTIKQGNPNRTLNISVIVTTQLGLQQPDVWDLIDHAVAMLDDTQTGDAMVFAKGDHSLDVGGGAACAAVDFEVRDY